MDITRIRQLAIVPRRISPELGEVLAPDDPIDTVGTWIMVLGLADFLVSAFGAWRGRWGIVPLLVAAGIILAGWGLRRLVRTRALARDAAEIEHAVVVIAGWVQGNTALFEPGDSTLPAVIAFAVEPPHMLDPNWTTALAKRLAALRNHGATDPVSAQLLQRLEAERSTFDEPLPREFTGGIAAHWKVVLIDQSRLPGKCLNADRLLVYFRTSQGNMRLVPGALWG